MGGARISYDHHEVDERITICEDDWEITVKALKKGKSPGEDGVSYGHFKYENEIPSVLLV